MTCSMAQPKNSTQARRRGPGDRAGDGFTLIEVLVALSVVALLLGVLLPGLSHARMQAQATVCQSNLRQLTQANRGYADEFAMFCPGAADFFRNRNRWHGVRATIQRPFNPTEGPLAPYLGPDAKVRACPSFQPDRIGFERGCGGYGYNNAYLGVQTVGDDPGEYAVTTDLAGAYVSRVARPGETVMFTDAALLSRGLIEYSFAEPRMHPMYGSRADPSIHFRHARTANVAWCDGHVSAERRTFTWSSGFYEGDPKGYDIGWFGNTDDNSLFDLR